MKKRHKNGLLNLFEFIVDRASMFMGIIAAIVLGLMMIISVIDIIGRYFFNTPISGTWEIVGMMLILGGTWGMAYCQREKAHINVTVILDLLSPKVRAIILSIANITGVIAFSIISWRTFLLTIKYFQIKGYVTDTLHIPLYPFTFAIALSSAMMVLAGLIDVIKNLNFAVKR